MARTDFGGRENYIFENMEAWEAQLVFCNFRSVGLASKRTTSKWKQRNLICIALLTATIGHKLQPRGHIRYVTSWRVWTYNWWKGHSLGLWWMLWACIFTSPLVNFVNLDDWLFSVGLSDRMYWLETEALIIPAYWAVVRMKCGGACWVFPIVCGDT